MNTKFGHLTAVVSLAGIYLLAACGSSSSATDAPAQTVAANNPAPVASSPPPPPPPPPPAPTGTIVAKTFTSGLANPWGMAFLPDGRILVTEKLGTLRLVSADGATVSAAITGVPTVDSPANSQGGLLGIAIDPAFATNRYVYMSYSEPGSGADVGKNSTAVARGQLSTDGAALTNVAVIFRQLPKIASQGHFGSRLVFGNDGNLWITMGERQSQSDQAQITANHIGKIVRIKPDGSVPADNPYVNTQGAAKELWTIGHRNVQGATKHPTTGELWTCEHGPQGGDEINREVPGNNYGWPVISYGQQYGTTTQVGEGTSKPGMEQPVVYWEFIDGSTPAAGAAKSSTAPSGLTFYTGDKFPEWKGNLFMGALAGKSLWRIELNGNAYVKRERLFADLNERIRDVVQGPDGWLYLLTDNSAGRIIRIER
jgi:aldose sugar dehydrogenase